MGRFTTNLLISVAVLLLVLAIFWKQIIATGFWVSSQEVLSRNPALTIIPRENTEYSRPETTILTYESLGTLQIPHLFQKSVVTDKSDSLLLIKNAEMNEWFLIEKQASLVASFKQNQAYSDEQFTQTCHTLTEITEGDTNICANDYVFFTTVLTTYPDDIHFFSFPRKKLHLPLLLLLKNAYLADTTEQIKPFTTKHKIRGYHFMSKQQESALIFDSNNEPYKITFHDMDTAAIESFLGNITDTAQQ